MIDPQSGDEPALKQRSDQAMNHLEHLAIFDANRRQFINVEEAAVVDFVRRHPPVGEPITLRAKQFLQAIKTARLADDAVDFVDCRRQRRLHTRPFADEMGQATPRNSLFAVAFCARPWPSCRQRPANAATVR